MRQIHIEKAGLLRKYVYQSDFDEFSEPRIVPRFNIAPSQNVIVIKRNELGYAVSSWAVWGFVPHWQQGTPEKRPINARDDKVLTSRFWRGAFSRSRCLVIADGLYEWLELESGEKQPYFIRFKDDRLFCFAGLWDRWHDPETNITARRTCVLPARRS